MLNSAIELHAMQRAAELETPLRAVEDRLLALATALSAHDAVAIDREACELHRALAAAIQHFGQAARSGGIPAALRQRLAHAGASVAAQREALARATAALDRAIDVLIPSAPASATYAASGNTDRAGGLAGAYLSA